MMKRKESQNYSIDPQLAPDQKALGGSTSNTPTCSIAVWTDIPPTQGLIRNQEVVLAKGILWDGKIFGDMEYASLPSDTPSQLPRNFWKTRSLATSAKEPEMSIPFHSPSALR